MFKTEIYRILHKRRNLAILLTGLLFILYYTMGNTVWGEALIDGGVVYRGTAAIAKDKEIAAAFTGILTADTVQAIWDKYGPPVNCNNRSTTWESLTAAAALGGNDNYCSRMVAELFGEAIAEGGQVAYVLRDGWEESRYLQGDYVFGYTGSTSWYWDRFSMSFLLAQAAVIVALCSMFCEDYACRIADIILPTVKGRMVLWRTRMAAGCLVASGYYWIACGSIFLQYIFFYGTDGLAVSCELAGVPMYGMQAHLPMGIGLLMEYLCGWFSTLVLTAFVGTVSVMSRQPFSALVRSLLLYAGPLAVMRLFLDSLPMGRVNMLLHLVCYSMPLSYPGSLPQAPDRERGFMTGIAIVAALAAVAAGAYKYCHYQVKPGGG